MPTYQLTGDVAVSLPNAALAARIHLPAHSVITTANIVPVRDGRIVTTAETRKPPGGAIQLILDGLAEPLTLRLCPDGGASFPAGAVIELSLSAEFTRSSDPYRVVLSAIDLSGLPWFDAVEVVPASSTLSVRRLGGHEEPLHGVAKEAHDAARAVLRRDALDPDEQIDLQVVVDGSASMGRWARSGLLGDVLQAVGGIDHVIGRDHLLDIRLSSDRQWRRISAEAASDVVSDILDGPLRSAVLGAWPASTEQVATIMVTDMTPADWSPGPRDCCVVLCPPETRELLAEGPKVVALSPRWDGAERLDETAVAALVAGVMASVIPADEMKETR